LPLGKRRDEAAEAEQRQRFLNSYPVRNPSVITNVDDKGMVELQIPLKKPSRLLRFFITPPQKKVIKLDRLGSFVWQRCDGKHRVQDIVDEMSAQFKLTHAECSASLSAFMKDLSRRRLVAFLVMEMPPAQAADGAESKTESEAPSQPTGQESASDQRAT